MENMGENLIHEFVKRVSNSELLECMQSLQRMLAKVEAEIENRARNTK